MPTPLFRSALRWLLQVDQPAPLRSDAEITAEMERNYRWNFTFNLLDGAFFFFGLSFASSSTIVPLFVSKLTPNPLAIGFVAVIAQAGWYLPQLFTANPVERLARKKPVVVNLGFFTERLPIWLLVIAGLVAAWSPPLALLIFFAGYAGHGLGAGLVATAWQDLLARCFPVDKRGRALGITSFVGTGTGALGAGFSAWLLATFPFPSSFTYNFLIAASAVTLSWFFLALIREPVQPSTAPRKSSRQFWDSLPAILHEDHNYRRFLIARILIILGGMGIGFVAVAAVRRFAVADSTVAAYTAALLIGQTIGNLIAGLLADRFGHKLSLEMGALASLLAFGLAWLAPVAGWIYLVFGLLGLATGAFIVSGILVVLEFAPPDRRPTYTGLTNTVLGLVSIVGPLLGAWLATISYDWLFIVSAAFNLISLLAMHWWVKEPRWANQASDDANLLVMPQVG